MKKLLFSLLSLFTVVSASAMSFEQAREQALFLTDKMAYELNLTEDQYEAAYEINFDYLCGIRTESDVFGVYWTNRNIDMCHVLVDWQYRAFCDFDYFYRPIYWDMGVWHFRIYGRYPCRTFFYFESRPAFWATYRGGHCWRACGGSYYSVHIYGSSHRGGGSCIGMRNNYRGTNHHGGVMSNGNGSYRHVNSAGHGSSRNGNYNSGSYRGGNSGNHSGSGSYRSGNRNSDNNNYRSGNRNSDNNSYRSNSHGSDISQNVRTDRQSSNRSYGSSQSGSSYQERGSSTRQSYRDNRSSSSSSYGGSNSMRSSGGFSGSRSSGMSSGSFSGGSRGGGFSGGGSRGGGGGHSGGRR